MSIAAGINWAANAAVGFSYPLLDDVIGGNTFFIFAGLLVIFVAFTYFRVPETKNKSVTEIQHFFIGSEPDSLISTDTATTL